MYFHYVVEDFLQAARATKDDNLIFNNIHLVQREYLKACEILNPH